MAAKRILKALASSVAVAALCPCVAFAQAAAVGPASDATEVDTTTTMPADQPPASTVQAPEDPALDGDREIEEMVVTAQRREESLSRVGISVTAVGAEELISRGVNDPSDLVRLVPGFQATTTYGGSPVYRVRGIGFNTRNVSSTAPVGIYLDETAVAYPYMSLGLLFDLERVEVLKGPQGTLYGRNATGGLVNYIAATPTDSLEGGFSFEAGNYGTLNASAFVSGPLTDYMRVRLAFNSLNRSEGYQQSISHGEFLGKLYQSAARLTLEFGNDGPFEATLTGNYWHRRGDTTGVQAIFYIPDASAATAPFGSPIARASIQPNPSRNEDVDFVSSARQPRSNIGFTRPDLMVDSEFYSATARLSYSFSDALRIQSLSTYQRLDQRDVGEAAGLPIESTIQDSRSDIETISQELRLIGEGSRFNWSAGGYYARDTVNVIDVGYTFENASITRLRAIARLQPQTRYTAAEINASFGNFRNTAELNTEVLAVFANAQYELSDLIKFTVGGRYTRDETSYEGCTRDTNGGSVALLNTVYPLFGVVNPNLQPNACYTLNAAGTAFVDIINGDKAESNLAWRANVDVTPNRNTLFYASVSRGYKSGGFPVISASSEVQLAPIEQERLTAFEVGTKLSLFDRSMQFNLAAFYYDYRDRQVLGRVLDKIFGTLARIRNVPRSRLYGAEAELTWRLTDTVTARVGAVYLNSKILEFSDFTELGAPANIVGQPFSYTPELQGNATLSYDGPINESLRLTAEASVSHQTESQADSAGTDLFRIGDRTLVDASLGLAATDDTWRVQLYATNLFDTYYWTGVSSVTETVFRYPGMPREIGVRTTFRF